MIKLFFIPLTDEDIVMQITLEQPHWYFAPFCYFHRLPQVVVIIASQLCSNHKSASAIVQKIWKSDCYTQGKIIWVWLWYASILITTCKLKLSEYDYRPVSCGS